VLSLQFFVRTVSIFFYLPPPDSELKRMSILQNRDARKRFGSTSNRESAKVCIN